MSLRNIHLRKLLWLFELPAKQRRSALRADIRAEIKKEQGRSGGSGDFHTGFWADAKAHVAGKSDLRVQTKARIESNKGRARLYNLLSESFLRWWNEKRRWRNEPFEFLSESVFEKYYSVDPAGVVKVENLIALRVGDRESRIIYPYFAETPGLTAESARIGLWLMHEAFPNRAIADLRILDVLRSSSFGIGDVPLVGNEEELFKRKYKLLLDEWDKLRDEYR
jgi:hypothetical protein